MSLDEALGMFGEAAQDLSSVGLAEAAGNFYNAADLSNQVAEKCVQAVYVLRNDARASYDHDLAALGRVVGVPDEVAVHLAALNPYHPSKYLDGHGRDLEAADDAVGPETAAELHQHARAVLKWARHILLSAE